MARFTLPRDLYHGKGSVEVLKTLKGKRAIVCVGGGSMKKFGFLDKVVAYLEEAGMEVRLFEGIEPDPSVDTVMKGAAVMQEFQPDWIVAMGGGSPIDAAKAMWIKYEYPEITFEEMCVVFGIPELRQKARFVAIPSTSGTATEVTAQVEIVNATRETQEVDVIIAGYKGGKLEAFVAETLNAEVAAVNFNTPHEYLHFILLYLWLLIHPYPLNESCLITAVISGLLIKVKCLRLL